MTTGSLYNEQELLSQIAAGDERAFTLVFEHYLGKIKPFIEKMTQSPDDAKEIIQLTFVQLWLHRDKLPAVSNLSGYIFKIAANQYHSYIRKKLLIERTLAGYKSVNPTGDDNTTERTVRLNELQKLISEAIQQLPGKRRQIFKLSRNEGMTIAEIAQHLSLSPKTVKNTLYAALADIREYLAAAGEGGYIWLFAWLFHDFF